MKRLIQRMMNGLFSVLTTLLIMASPVAAMVYAAEPADTGIGHPAYSAAQPGMASQYGGSVTGRIQVKDWTSDIGDKHPGQDASPKPKAFKIVE